MARVLSLCFPLISNLSKPCCLSTNEVFPLGLKSLVRRYGRKSLGRTPIKIINPGEDESTAWVKDKSKKHENEEDSSMVPRYVKLRDDNTVFTSLISKAKSRKEREKSGKILLEGKRLIRDALEAGAVADSIFFSQEETLEGLCLAKLPNLKLFKITYKQLSLWSDLTTSPGIIGIFDLFDYQNSKVATPHSLPLTVICDKVREPGNLGSILRCAAAVGCKQILLTKGCVDLWEPKVLRAACGAHFRSNMENNLGWESMCNYVSRDTTMYLASSHGADDADNADADEPEEFSPHQPKTQWHYTVGEDGRMVQHMYAEGKYEEDSTSASRRFPIGSSVYHDVDFSSNKEIAVVVGGETEGLSKEARRFTQDRYGQSVFIPLENNVESLNSGVALGIILFEIQRQLRVASSRRATSPS